MSFITSIGTANPKYRVRQDRIADFMVRAMQLDYTNERRLRAIFRSSGIDYRHSVLPDFELEANFEFFPNSRDFEPFPSTKKRSEMFRRHALSLSLCAIHKAISPEEFSSITHLITVCCTGMYAPGLDIDIIKELGLSSNIHRICINFMGCYAAVNALKTADAFCQSDPAAKVLIVCTEICSLHFQKQITDDNMLSNALFGDGSAAVLMESHAIEGKALQPLNFHTDLMYEGRQDMAWNIGDFGFEMKLSSYVPQLIEKGINGFLSSLLKNAGNDISQIKYFAIHPGGKKILSVVEDKLNLRVEQNKFAHDVLRNFGNMSSPTVLFVLKEIFQRITAHDHDEYVLSLAFGPGLTLGSILFKIRSM